MFPDGVGVDSYPRNDVVLGPPKVIGGLFDKVSVTGGPDLKIDDYCPNMPG